MKKKQQVKNSSTHVLVVCNDHHTVKQIRQGLLLLGISNVTTPNNLNNINQTLPERFSHVIFEVAQVNDATRDFVFNMLLENSDATLIAIAKKLGVDDIFELLRIGVRGFLVHPFSNQSLEQVFLSATSKIRVSEVVFQNTSRNPALVEGVLNLLDQLADAKADARSDVSMSARLPKYLQDLRDASEMGFNYCEGGQDTFIATIVEACIMRANGQKNRLRLLRDYLSRERQDVIEP